MMQRGGHHVFQQHAKAGARGRKRQPAAQRARSNNGDGQQV